MKACFAKRWCIIFFALLFAFGISNTGDYGRPIDEKPEQEILLMNIKEYASIIGIDVKGAAFGGLNRISESVEQDHGIAAYYFFAPILLLTGRETLASMHTWHYYTFMLWFLGLLGLYSILKSTYRSYWTPAIVTLIYYFTPRIFAEGHYNNKDIVLLSLIFLSLACTCALLKRWKTKDIVSFSIASGFLMNCKIIGIAIWGITGLFAIAYAFLTAERKLWVRRLSDLALAAVMSGVVFFILTPAMWRNPIGYIQYCFTNATGFSRWSKSFLFNGESIQPMITGVPRTYVVQWIMMTIPLYVIVLFVTSIGVFAKDIIIKRERILYRQFFFLLFITAFSIPVLVSVLKAPSLVLYNGWRHNYYLYAFIILCSGYAVDRVLENSRPDARIAVVAITIIGFIVTVGDMIINRSFEYMYFNPIARAVVDMEEFEGDYWNVSVMPAMKAFAAEQNADYEIVISPQDYAADNQLKNVDVGNYRIVGEDHKADYYLFNTSMTSETYDLEKYEKVYSFLKYGRELCGIYKLRTE